MDDLPSKQEQREHCQEGQTRGQNRPAQSLVDAAVYQLNKVFPLVESNVFPDPIKDHNRVVHGLADQRQQSRNHGQADFLIEQREKTQGNNDIMKSSDHRSDAV